MGVIKNTLSQEIVWENNKFIVEIPKTEHLKYVLSFTAREGIRYLNIREFYFTKRAGEWRPSLNGLAIPLMMPVAQEEDGSLKIFKVLEHFPAIFEKALKELPDFPLSDPDNVVLRPPRKEKVK